MQARAWQHHPHVLAPAPPVTMLALPLRLPAPPCLPEGSRTSLMRGWRKYAGESCSATACARSRGEKHRGAACMRCGEAGRRWSAAQTRRLAPRPAACLGAAGGRQHSPPHGLVHRLWLLVDLLLHVMVVPSLQGSRTETRKREGQQGEHEGIVKAEGRRPRVRRSRVGGLRCRQPKALRRAPHPYRSTTVAP